MKIQTLNFFLFPGPGASPRLASLMRVMDDMPGVLLVYGAVLVSYFLVAALVSNLEFVSFVSGWVLEFLRCCFWVPLRIS